MNNQIKIIIADDHPIVRKGLRQVIESDAQLLVLAEANDGEEALTLIEQLQPDVALIDVDMPKMDGFQTAQELIKRNLPVKFIFLTIHSGEQYFHSAMDLGANGYLLKESAISEIINAIKTVAEGNFFVSSSLTSFLIKRRRDSQNLAEQKPSINQLTATEKRILRLIADYKSSKEIAEEIFVHPRTVDSHRNNISRKLDIHGHKALLKFAVENKREL
jgi:DNA-binding NarL/FixJ family response regulator